MIVTTLLKLHNQLKMFHWQTKKYAEHQAFGQTYDVLTGFIDEFVEILMGKRGRVDSDGGFAVHIDNYTSTSEVVSFLDTTIDYLNGEGMSILDDSDTDLLNIRDEIVGQLNKLKYLLTLS